MGGQEEYKFGDISRKLDLEAKSAVCNFTGRDSYEFGDISKEIARRVRDGEVEWDDMSILLRAVLTFGLGLSPVAHLLPIQLLLGWYTQALQAEAGARATGKVGQAVAEELDRRAKGAILGEGNENYVLGDWTKARLQEELSKVTGKDQYQFGDITKAMVRAAQEKR